MRPITLNKVLETADADGIAVDQQLAAAGDLVLNGALGAGGPADDDGVALAQATVAAVALTLEAAYTGAPRRITLTSSADLSLINFTIVGLDADDNAIGGTIAGPNNGTVAFTGIFKEVTSITPDDTSGADTVEAGWATFGPTDGIVLDTQRRVILDSAADLSLITFTIYGTDDAGNGIFESIAGPAAAPVSTTRDFKTVTRIAASAAVASDVSAGTSDVGATPVVPMDINLTPFQVTVQVNVDGTVDYSLYYTLSDIWDPDVLPIWFAHSTMAAQSADAVATLISPVTAVRVQINSGAGSIEARIVQAGNQ